MREIRVPANTIVFKENDEANCMYYIKQGQVKIIKGLDTVREHELAQLGAGVFFGELGLIDHAKRNASAICMTESILQEITGEVFLTKIDEDREMVDTILMTISKRIRQTDALYIDALNTIAMLECSPPPPLDF